MRVALAPWLYLKSVAQDNENALVATELLSIELEKKQAALAVQRSRVTALAGQREVLQESMGERRQRIQVWQLRLNCIIGWQGVPAWTLLQDARHISGPIAVHSRQIHSKLIACHREGCSLGSHGTHWFREERPFMHELLMLRSVVVDKFARLFPSTAGVPELAAGRTEARPPGAGRCGHGSTAGAAAP